MAELMVGKEWLVYGKIVAKDGSSAIKPVTSRAFGRYGRIVAHALAADLRQAAAAVEMPSAGTRYERSVPALEQTEGYARLIRTYAGGQPFQAGLVWGYNTKLNALEYHRASELILAVTDLVLLLGDRRDLVDLTYDSALIEAFFVPAGESVELYATSMHYAPCQTSDAGYKAIIMLPRETNAPPEDRQAAQPDSADMEHRLYFARDKWLIAHPDTNEARRGGAYAGIIGRNPDLQDFLTDD
jgi:hypothetical protein